MSLKQLQLWVHKHNQGISSAFKYALLIAILIFSIFTYRNGLEQNRLASERAAAQAAENARIIKEHQDALKESIGILDHRTRDIKWNSDRNTKLIACLFFLHGAASPVDEQDEEECRDMANERLDLTRSPQRSPGPFEEREQDSSSQNNKPNTQPPKQPKPPVDPPPTENDDGMVVELLEDVLNDGEDIL